MELRQGHAQKACWTLLRVGEENKRNNAQRFYSCFGWPSIQKKEELETDGEFSEVC